MSEKVSFPITRPITVLIGPTAIGKTALSIELAQQFDFEIISVDSMQVYRHMDIGTAKITKDEMMGIPHHLIGVVNPDEPFDAGKFEKLSLTAIEEIIEKGKNVLLTGGTGLYLKALINGLSVQIPAFPEIRKEINNELTDKGRNVLHEQLMSVDCISAKRIHKNDTHRLIRALEIFKGTGEKWSSLIAEHKKQREIRFPNLYIIGLTCGRDKLYSRIEKRSQIMLQNGLQQEVEQLINTGYNPDLKSMQSIGYHHMVKMLKGEWTKQEMIGFLARDTKRYAKRQFTWFKKIEGISWFDINDTTRIPDEVQRFLSALI
ncbi:MAG TPA: tRNA (adenosine(37)-N6)-dimethylallyltransferase MiaA [Desulfobacterales bacterium]|nr:tRNA (adenosine(37)-N6)-dimethylallyltransferase MiaA [Desulfobacterales bacterium]HIP39520.1 tRNA (adenosine(37)-N6)-dimethylallyltransferase MiaA [Desulfocapsa sulfexigens]